MEARPLRQAVSCACAELRSASRLPTHHLIFLVSSISSGVPQVSDGSSESVRLDHVFEEDAVAKDQELHWQDELHLVFAKQEGTNFATQWARWALYLCSHHCTCMCTATGLIQQLPPRLSLDRRTHEWSETCPTAQVLRGASRCSGTPPATAHRAQAASGLVNLGGETGRQHRGAGADVRSTGLLRARLRQGQTEPR